MFHLYLMKDVVGKTYVPGYGLVMGRPLSSIHPSYLRNVKGNNRVVMIRSPVRKVLKCTVLRAMFRNCRWEISTNPMYQ